MGENLKFIFVGQGRDVCVEAPASSYDIFELEKGVPSWVAGVPHQDTIPSRALLFTTYSLGGSSVDRPLHHLGLFSVSPGPQLHPASEPFLLLEHPLPPPFSHVSPFLESKHFHK